MIRINCMVGGKYRPEENLLLSDSEKELRNSKNVLSQKIEELQEDWIIFKLMDHLGLKRLEPLPKLNVLKEALQAFIRGCKTKSELDKIQNFMSEIERRDEDL